MGQSVQLGVIMGAVHTKQGDEQMTVHIIYLAIGFLVGVYATSILALRVIRNMKRGYNETKETSK